LPDGLSPPPDIAARDYVAFGDHVFDSQMQVRHRLAHVEHHLLVAIRPDGFPAGSMHSIVYMVILTRIVERFDCSKMTAVDFVASTAGQKVKIFWLEMERVLFQASGGAESFFWSAAVSTNPNLL
jgi:hypothetical protein